MKKMMYVTKDIEELDVTEHQLEEHGIPRSHIHVLSKNTSVLRDHDLPEVSEWSKRDVFRLGLMGAMIGLTVASLMLVIAFANDVESTTMLLVSFTAIFVMGFTTWEGGFIGIQRMNHHLVAFKSAIENGAHVMIVDADTDQEQRVRDTVAQHPTLQAVA